MKKLVLKSISFLLIFIMLFSNTQKILQWKDLEDLNWRYESYRDEERSIDILFLGTSQVYAGIVPMIFWKEEGITSVNFGTSNNTAVLNMYETLFALEYQTPEIIVLDFSALFEDRRADDLEIPYRKFFTAVPDRSVKRALAKQLLSDNKEQDIASYYIPLLRYHGRWNELTVHDFIGNEYKEYKKGALLDERILEWTNDEEYCTEDIEAASYSEYSYEYYMKILEICKGKDIKVVAVSFPRKIDLTLCSQYKALEQFCTQNKISYYNLNTHLSWEEYNFDSSNDFYNETHLNIKGSIKLSKKLAAVLREAYDLEDHRGDPAYKKWEENWNAFEQDYQEYLEGYGY